ncbi:hypothetical protein D9Q98_004328 [Chlorella vulgaris]|uniref:Small ribosomal subunit protein uS9c n=1 Tax=Chlorella vulgaris TaxID=3077 RepID=A0A9D4YX12_CHLVU|nr:hypothetical protein D9Q98_004328 [Chlorella vulgaris]
MLRNGMKALQRVAALQWCREACAASGGGITANLPSLAVAMQQLALQQQLSWASNSQPSGCRQFAASAGGGGDGGSDSQQQHAADAAALSEGNDAVQQLASESGQLVFKDYEESLEAWGKAMDEGDWGTAWDIFEGVLPVETDQFPDLQELLAWDPDEEAKEYRRLREARVKEMHAARWVRRLDPSGRALGVGKRKTSVALVWLKEGSGHMMINRRPYDSYFPDMLRRNDLLAPFLVTGTLGRFDIMVRVTGGGQTGQSQAVRHGIARALQNWEPAMRPPLKVAGLLTRDSRIVERKKPGLKKARKAFQWVKR